MSVKMRMVAIGLGLSLFACSGGGDDDDDDDQKKCADDSKVTYDAFARPFFDTYCVSCHASGLAGSARQGAPEGYDFDTLANIRKVTSSEIALVAAAGDGGTNRGMPPPDRDVPKPSDADRRKLDEWLACGRR